MAQQAEEVGRFTIELTQHEGYDFSVRFDWPRVEALVMDEPPPLGEQRGPNASRVLAAAVGHCLSASLMYCLAKAEVPPEGVHTSVTCKVVRNERGRMRVGSLDVEIELGGELLDSKRLPRCLDLFDDFCTVTASIREGIPVSVRVTDAAGNELARPPAD